MLHEPLEQTLKVGLLLRGEHRQQGFHYRSGPVPRGLQPGAAGRGNADLVGPAVGRASPPLRQPLPFQFVDDVHHRRLVQAEGLDDLPLAAWSCLCRVGQHAKVAQLETVRLHRLVGGGAGVPVGLVKEESNPARRPEHRTSGRVGCGLHVGMVASRDRLYEDDL